MRLLDKRFAGIARGVGTAKILGRVHSAPLKVADLHLTCSYTVMEGRDVDLLFGLDMLRAHQACIDLEKNCLRINGREIRFLAEHELPDKAKVFEAPPEDSTQSSAMPGSSGSGASQASGTTFPGSGSTLGTAPRTTGASGRSAQQVPAQSQYSEEAIQTLVGLGATREVAIQLLSAANGNLDVAAGWLF
jgi:DNA damage-inducible protein 1